MKKINLLLLVLYLTIVNSNSLNGVARSNNKNVQCAICCKLINATHLTKILNHFKAHTCQHACTRCNTVYSSKAGLDQHICNGKSTSITCKLCNYSFSRKSCYQQHVCTRFDELTDKQICGISMHRNTPAKIVAACTNELCRREGKPQVDFTREDLDME